MARAAHSMAAVSAVLVCLIASEARAQEFCVACSGPDALYRCVLENAQPGGGQSLQMLCITAMAKQGGHATCAVKRGTVFQCDGAIKRVPWAAVSPSNQPREAPAAQPPSKSEQVAAPPPAPAAPPPGTVVEGAPDTVLDMAKRANEDTAKQMKKAGDSVKEATKKTWDCVFSLFTRC